MPSKRKPRGYQRPTAAPGETPTLLYAKEPCWELVCDAAGNVLRVVPAHGFNANAFRHQKGMPIPLADWCEPTHDTCDLNPDVAIPPALKERWEYAHFVVYHTVRSRTTRLCVDCTEMMLQNHWDSTDWATIEELRSECLTAMDAARQEAA